MDCAYLVHQKVGAVTLRKELTYCWSDGQLDDIFEDGNTVPHQNLYIEKVNLQKTLEITVI